MHAKAIGPDTSGERPHNAKETGITRRQHAHISSAISFRRNAFKKRLQCSVQRPTLGRLILDVGKMPLRTNQKLRIGQKKTSRSPEDFASVHPDDGDR